MIIDFDKTAAEKNLQWSGFYNHSLYCEAVEMFKGPSKRHLNFKFVNSSDSWDIYYNPNSITKGSYFEKHGFFLYKNDEPLIARIRKDIIGGLPKFISLKKERYVIETKIDDYYVYDISRLDGRYLFVYKDNVTVAAVFHPNTVVDFKDKYKLYIDEKAIPTQLIISLCLFWDVSVFDSYEADMVTGIKIKSKGLEVQPQVIREKYNPDFISEIKAMDGIID